MLAIPELQIQTVLQEGFAAIAAETALLDDLFSAYAAEMRAEVKTYLTNHKIEVVLNWPREGQTQPTIAIVNAGDAEDASKDALGDFFGSADVEDFDADLTEYHGIALNGSYQLYVLSQDPRLTVYLAYLVLSILVRDTMRLQSAGLHNVTVAMSDLRFEEGLLPEWANSRMVTLTCLHYHAVPRVERLLTGLEVKVTAE